MAGASVTEPIERWLARHRRNRLVGRSVGLMRRLVRGYDNFSYDFHTNGESRVLRLLAAGGNVTTVFDVGANTGEWASMAAATFPGARIHSFEIVPDTAAEFRRRTRGLDRVVLNEVGLSDVEGTTSIHTTGHNSPMATCVPGFADEFHGVATDEISVRTTTGDQYCAANGVETIDFLKIDVEGLEDKVLAGFAGLLEHRAIRVVQFEYGFVNIASRFLLKDFHDFLEPRGFVVGKIYPDHVDFRSYRHRDEDFLGPNFLAVQESETALVAALSGG